MPDPGSARLAPIAPSELTDEQRVLHDDMVTMIGEHLQGFVSQRADGALVGPFAPMLHFPAWGAAAWQQTRSMMTTTVLPKGPHEVVILVVGAALGSRYELYAHEHVAASTTLSATKIATLCAGQRPGDLTPDEAAAHDMTAALMAGGPLPTTTYQVALEAFGEQGAAEIVFLAGTYCFVSALLNGFDMAVPGPDA